MTDWRCVVCGRDVTRPADEVSEPATLALVDEVLVDNIGDGETPALPARSAGGYVDGEPITVAVTADGVAMLCGACREARP